MKVFLGLVVKIHQFDLDNDIDEVTTYYVIGRNSAAAAASYEIRLIPSSGSAP